MRSAKGLIVPGKVSLERLLYRLLTVNGSSAMEEPPFAQDG
jgi:hypothetical protein